MRPSLARLLLISPLSPHPNNFCQGACCAETLAQNGVETFLLERKMDNCKPCGGAIPVCMIEEFKLPAEIIDRKVRLCRALGHPFA